MPWDSARRYPFGQTALTHLCATHEVDMDRVAELIENGASVNEKNRWEQTPLHLCADFGQKDAMQLLIQHGANVNGTDGQGKTALMIACKRLHAECVQLLCSSGADVTHQTSDGTSAASCLMYRVEEDECNKVLTILLDSGVDCNMRMSHNNSLLMCAARYKNATCMRTLIARGAALHQRNSFEQNALMLALERPHKKTIEVVSLLINSGCDVNNGVDWEGDTPLMYAVTVDDPVCVNMLLKAGAIPTISNDIQQTPLHRAVEYDGDNRCDIMDELIRFGADLNARDDISRSPLLCSVERGDERAMNILLQAGASAVIQDNELVDPVMYALEDIKAPMKPLAVNTKADLMRRVVTRLLAAGADVNLRNKRGSSALLYALEYQNFDNECFDLILQHGASVNVQDSTGVTPFIGAIMGQNVDSALKLIRCGCNRSGPAANAKTWHDHLLWMTRIVRALSKNINPTTAQQLSELFVGAGEVIPLDKVGHPCRVLEKAFKPGGRLQRMKHMCRLTIRKQLSMCSMENLVTQIDRLPLPRAIKRYLCFFVTMDHV